MAKLKNPTEFEKYVLSWTSPPGELVRLNVRTGMEWFKYDFIESCLLSMRQRNIIWQAGLEEPNPLEVLAVLVLRENALSMGWKDEPSDAA